MSTPTNASNAMAAAAAQQKASNAPANSSANDGDTSLGIGNIILQLVGGILIVYCVYLIAIIAIRADRLTIDSKYDTNKKRKTIIFDGYADSTQFANGYNVVNTSVPHLYNYVPVQPSANLRGGSQFTYSLWVHVQSNNFVTDNVANKCIFLKGDKNAYTYSIRNTNEPVNNQSVTDRIAFCPMLCFGSGTMDFKVYFNTMHKIKEEMEIKRMPSTDSAMRNNIMSLFSNKWVLLTLSFEDNVPINDFENGIQIKFFVNDTLYQTNRYNSALKQNNGLLYMFPDGAVPVGCKISNFCYFNYAVTDKEVRELALRGPSDKPIESVTKSFISPTMLSDYNRLDVYNL